MNAAIDHVFVLCAEGAPESEALARLGFVEGSPNTHPGQGTACRRFFFADAYLELLWVADACEAQAEAVVPTRLFERWSQRGGDASPFGIVLRPAGDASEAPFPSWSYQPPYLPPGLSIELARETPLAGPEFFYLPFLRDRGGVAAQPVGHALPLGSLTGVTVWRPAGGDSQVARSLQAAGLVGFHDGDGHLLELRFDEADRGRADLRPALPLVLRW